MLSQYKVTVSSVQSTVTKLLVPIFILINFLFTVPSNLYPLHAAPPTNFQTSLVVGTGLEGPSGFDIAPDGRIFILERTGKIKIVKDGALLSTPFTDLPSIAAGDRGLIGIAFDPNFFNNHYVYFYYTGLDLLNRLVRFDASGDVATQGPLILYQTTFLSEQLHVGGGIRFGPDGKLWFAVGDNGYGPNAQDLSNPHGKLLRINSDGSIPNDNPFVGVPNALPEIWAHGFRNPWKFSFHPTTHALYTGDVGEATTEEINKVVKGANYGWPLCEGSCSNPSFINPIHTYNHDGGSAAVTLGPIYNGTLFPEEYQGNLFFGDYAKGFIKRMVLNNEGGNGGVFDFDTNAGSVVEMRVAPDGTLYYLTYIPGALYKITYSTGNHIPVPNATASVTKGTEPLTINFSSSGTVDPDGDKLTYNWDFGDSTISADPNPVKTYTQKGKYIVQLKVSDATTQAPANPIVIQVGLPPTVTIGAPANNSDFKAGDTIFYSSSAVDGAGFDIDDGDITTEVVFHHQTHIHPFLGPLKGNKSGSFAIPTTGESSPEIWYEIIVTATDSNGLTDTKSVRVNPVLSTLNFDTQPSGLKVLLDGIPFDTPVNIQSVVGFKREISVTPTQKLNNNYFAFDNWSDGKSIRHIITTTTNPTTYTANFVPTQPFIGQYFNNIQLQGNPVLTREDAAIDFQWDGGSPDALINNDDFSARWSKQHFLSGGRYEFTTLTDDGVRLYIDGNLVIDEWYGQSGTPHKATVDLTTGEHEIIMEYFEMGGGAMAKLTWDLAFDQPSDGTNPPPATSGYSGEYFTNQTLSGQPVLTKIDPEINFDFGNGSPTPDIPVDNYSIRWTRTTNFTNGNYNFEVFADDGVRLYVDDELLIDKWIDQPATRYEAQKTLSSGNHTIKLEYYENGGGAIIQFGYQQLADPAPTPTPPPSIDTYVGEYFDNITLSGTPIVNRSDDLINFVWNDGSPDPLIPSNEFSARWVKEVNLSSGIYKFTTSSDDGVRIYLDNEIILDKWVDQPTTTHTVEKTVTAGTHIIKVEYYEKFGLATMIFNYEKISETDPTPTPTPTPIPTPIPTTYTGEYWNLTTTDFPPIFPTTAPTLTREDLDINFIWNDLSPDSLINVDKFAARWTKTSNFETGTYEFTTISDDGVRVYIDDELILNDWTDHAVKTTAILKTLSSGTHTIKVEYYENSGGAIAKFSYKKIENQEPTPTPPPSTDGFMAEFFDNITLSGDPILTRLDSIINFIWNEDAPDPVVPQDQFSARWTKIQHFTAGSYTFTTKSDDGVRLYIDNQLIIDEWNDHAMKTNSATIVLEEGDHLIKLEYYESGGGAIAILEY